MIGKALQARGLSFLDSLNGTKSDSFLNRVKRDEGAPLQMRRLFKKLDRGGYTMSIRSMIATDRGGDFVNERRSFLGKTITQITVTLPTAQIANTSATSGIRSETGPDGVLNTLMRSVQTEATVVMYDPIGDALAAAGSLPERTEWTLYVEGVYLDSTETDASSNEADLALRIQDAIRSIGTNFSGYDFNHSTAGNRPTVALGDVYHAEGNEKARNT